MEEHISIVGKVRKVSGTEISVYCLNSKTTYQCRCPFRIPVRVGDTISGFCRKSDCEFVQVPFVQLSVDKDTIMACLFQALGRGRDRPVLPVYQIYDSLVQASRSGRIDEDLSELAVLWARTKDESVFEGLGLCAVGDLVKVAEYWYRDRIFRQLRCFGLTYEDIFAIDKPVQTIKGMLLVNPYLLYTLPIEKADACVRLVGLSQLSGDDREAGVILRQIYGYQQRGWTGVPSGMARKMWGPYLEFLCAGYGCVVDNSTLYIRAALEMELYVARRIERLLEVGDRVWPEFEWTCPQLTDEQRAAVRAALTKPIVCITGAAGTGKTQCIREIVNELQRERRLYVIGSYTGKAVARVAEVIGRGSPQTIHRLLSKAESAPKFEFLIIDEASMMTTELFHATCTRFPHHFSVVLIGDVNQLEPIGCGSLFEECIKSGKIPTYVLGQVHRTQSGSGILENSMKICQYARGGHELPPFEFCPSETFQICQGDVTTVVGLVKALRAGGIEDVRIVTPYTKDVDELNLACQGIFSSDRGVRDAGGIEWRVGDRVSLRANRYDISLMNGSEGTIVSVSEDSVGVQFLNGRTHAFQLRRTKTTKKRTGLDPEADFTRELTTASLRLSFCLTIHRAQGSEFDFCILYIPPAPKLENIPKIQLHRKLVYTAITRAKRSLWCIGDVVHLTMAATKPAPFRCDNLGKRLSHVDEEIVFV